MGIKNIPKLIKQCGETFSGLHKFTDREDKNPWTAFSNKPYLAIGMGKTLEEALTKLLEQINKKRETRVELKKKDNGY